MEPVCILITTEWNATIKQTAIDGQSWEKPASRHIKLAAFVAGPATAGKKDSNGRTTSNQECPGVASFHPIHCAASQGMLSAARQMLKESCSDQEVSCKTERLSNLMDGSGRSPLHWAAIMGQNDVMCLLLDHGASLDCRDPLGRTPLFSAAAFGQVTAVKLLLERGAEKDGQDSRGLTPLHAAASGGHLEAAYMLLSAHVDPRSRAAVGATPRHIAERHGHVQMVKLLVAAERRAGAEAAVCGENPQCPRKEHGSESFLTQLRRDRCTATRKSA
eukprot:jgi/Undpi1/4779/HiC_scaffold_19.g08132.m1